MHNRKWKISKTVEWTTILIVTMKRLTKNDTVKKQYEHFLLSVIRQ